jgi:hypothetical protein
MRFLLNILAALLVCALVAGGVWQYRLQQDDRLRLEDARSSVRQLQRTVTVQAGLGKAEVNGRGWPVTIDPTWFGGAPPWNALVTRQRPWVEVAPPEHADLLHPIVRMTINDDVAAFWYNPGNGIIRARVPVTVSDRQATELYNSVNGTALRSIFEETGPGSPTESAPVVAGASSGDGAR